MTLPLRPIVSHNNKAAVNPYIFGKWACWSLRLRVWVATLTALSVPYLCYDVLLARLLQSLKQFCRGGSEHVYLHSTQRQMYILQGMLFVWAASVLALSSS